MAEKNEKVERTLISVSLTINDRDKVRELAVLNDTTVSGLISKWIRERYEKEIGGKVQ